MNYIKKLYSGRISRKNYGLGILFFIAFFLTVVIFVNTLLVIILTPMSVNSFLGGFAITMILYVVYILYFFSLHARRFHDLGKSAWMVLLWLVPLVNLIIFIWLLTAKSKDETNKYGEIPLKSIKFFDAIFNRG